MHIDLGVLKIDLNITSFQIYNSSISDDNDQINIKDGHVILDIRGLTLNFSCDYAYITDPPYFADIGSSFILFDNGNVLIDGASVFDNEELNITISKFQT